jgi:Skp family chaperone for outer membrane proteins
MGDYSVGNQGCEVQPAPGSKKIRRREIMKRLLRAGGVCLFVGTLVLVGRSWSDTRPGPAAPRGRVAVLNMTYVIKNYKKSEAFRGELQTDLKWFQDRRQALDAGFQFLLKDLADPGLPAEKRRAMEDRLAKLRQQEKEAVEELGKFLRNRSEKRTQVLYRDVQEAAERYARAHDLELVLSYTEAPEEGEQNAPANVTRRMTSPGCFPLYAAPGVDISKEIVDVLNERLRSEKEAAKATRP